MKYYVICDFEPMVEKYERVKITENCNEPYGVCLQSETFDNGKHGSLFTKNSNFWEHGRYKRAHFKPRSRPLKHASAVKRASETFLYVLDVFVFIYPEWGVVKTVENIAGYIRIEECETTETVKTASPEPVKPPEPADTFTIPVADKPSTGGFMEKLKSLWR